MLTAEGAVPKTKSLCTLGVSPDDLAPAPVVGVVE